jgi:hypothetical protein
LRAGCYRDVVRKTRGTAAHRIGIGYGSLVGSRTQGRGRGCELAALFVSRLASKLANLANLDPGKATNFVQDEPDEETARPLTLGHGRPR